jgi:hypothetical protein
MEVIDEQPLYNPIIEVTFELLKFLKLTEINFGQFINIKSIFTREEVFKFDKSAEINSEPLPKKYSILSTFVALKNELNSSYINAII